MLCVAVLLVCYCQIL